MYAPFKRSINETLYRVANARRALVTETCEEAKPLSIFDVCSVFGEAYNSSFTRSNIANGFSAAGLWPYDPNRLLSRPLPVDEDQIDKVVVDDLR